MGNKLKGPHPMLRRKDSTDTREVQSKPRLHVENRNTLILSLVKLTRCHVCHIRCIQSYTEAMSYNHRL